MTSSGVLRYVEDHTAKLVIDPEIARYYKNFIPKCYYVQPQMYPAHITVVRKSREEPTNWEAWGKYEGREISFSYNPKIYRDGSYFSMEAFSKDLEDIREELGLPRIRTGFDKFHITIANNKS